MVWSGITTAERLAAARPYVIVGCFVIGMVLTPPDVISQCLLAIPMWMLFEIGVLVAKVIGRENAPE
jgi:sec-independent protein translocase protein TatC